MRTVTLPDGSAVAALGQGTWKMGEGHHSRDEEQRALRLGIDLGMTLIDTAEMYGDGGSEEVVGDAISGQRDRVFLVSKVYPHNASLHGAVQACERSLKRLRTEMIDLYLLHWPGSVPLSTTIEAFERLKRDGKIRHWGVSNFGADLIEDLDGTACATDQVLYNVETRGVEFDLLTLCEARRMPVMAYSPIGQAGRLLRSKALGAVAARHGATAGQIAIAWTMRRPDVISIPKASDPAHVRENADAAKIVLSPADLAEIDATHPPPIRKQSLAML